MIFLIFIAVILIYSPAALWMLDRGGVGKLWLTFAITFLSIILLGTVVATIHNVPNTIWLVLFLCGFGGPDIAVQYWFLASQSLLSVGTKHSSARGGRRRYFRTRNRNASGRVRITIVVKLLSWGSGAESEQRRRIDRFDE